MPDEVIDAISAYLRESNANVGGPFETSERTVHVVGCGARSRRPLSRLLARRGDVRRQHDLAVVRALRAPRAAASSPETRSSSPASTTTATSRRGSSWLTTSASRSASPTSPTNATSISPISSDSFPRVPASSRSRCASNAVGTLTDVPRIVELAHGAGALAWADAVHAAPHVPTDVAAWGVDVLLCSPYKFFGPHLGVAYVRREVAEGWRPYKVRPQSDEPLGHRFETGTQPFELLAGFVAAVEYVESIGWSAIQAHERSLGERFLDGLPEDVTLYGRQTMDGRVPTFMFTVDGHCAGRGRAAARRAGHRPVAWQLLRARGAETARARGLRRRRARGLRPLQHPRRGRSAARGARRSVSVVPDPVELLRDLLRFDTTNPPGAERECIEHVRGLLSAAGVESELYARDARATESRRAPPRVERRHSPLLLYGHVDVVPTAGQQWTHPPFSADDRRRDGLGTRRARHEGRAWR